MVWTSLITQGKRRHWMSLLVATMLSLVYFHFWRFYQGRLPGWILLVGWVPVAANLLRAGLGLVTFLDRHPFRAIDLGLESDQVSPGERFVVEIRVVARRPVLIR
ncbi:MAG TPA: hypothetical protein VLK65_12215, partial [Vicinamibacteria bacterium]|nr:hypothetical protein [Vicinamibacteria bacterium]